MSSQISQRLIGLSIALLLFGITLLSVDRRETAGLIRLETFTTRAATVGDGASRDALRKATNVFTTERNGNESSSETAAVSSTVGLVDYCVGDSYATLKKLIAYNRRVYADKWNYTIFSGNEEVFPVQTFVTPLAWLKAAYFYHLLTSAQVQDIEWFLWIDCDALITRFDSSIPQILEDLHVQLKHDVVMAQDPNTEFNSGVMFVRNSEWSRDLWKHTLQKASDIAIREHVWWEQQALLELYRENQYDEESHILITPDRWKINAFRTPRRNGYNASSFAWHRVNCREQPKCNDLFEAFFCDVMPNGTYLEELVDCGNVNDSLLDTF